LLDLVEIAIGLTDGESCFARKSMRHQGQQHRHADEEDDEEPVRRDDRRIAAEQRP
jgi:hypothetical protein